MGDKMKKERLNLIIFIINVICSVITLVHLPEMVPSYFDSQGQIVRYANKYELALLFPVLSIIVYCLLNFIQNRLFDKNHEGLARFFKTYFIFFFTFENVRFLLNTFNIQILNSVMLIMIIGIAMLFISAKCAGRICK